MHADEATLLDVAAAACLVLDFSEGMDKADFLDDSKTQMTGMRDKLIHAYDIVDLEEVWKMVNRDVPDLLHWLETRLPKDE